MREVLRSRPAHNRMMMRQLPRMKDEYFLSMSAAMHGVYAPQYQPEQSAADQANQELNEFAARAQQAKRRYYERKAMR